MSKDSRFSIVPAWAITEPSLKPRDLQVLCLLGRHTDKQGWCRRSQVKMAAELNCARSTIQGALDRLAEIGVVEKHETESADGRDSAHFYRVIYDRAPPQGYDFGAWQGEEEEENSPLDQATEPHPPADQSAPPAGISAPPADSGPAPPADSGPAPINDPYLTPPSNRGARAPDRRGEEKGKEKLDRKKVEDQFAVWFKTWPGKGSMDYARNAWLALSAEERAACIEKTSLFLSWSPQEAAKAPATYLAGREWQQVPEDFGRRTHGVAKVGGKLWNGIRLEALSQEPTGRFVITAFDQRRIHHGGITRGELLRDKRRDHGWPLVNRMTEAARHGEPFKVALDLQPYVEGFVNVARSSATFAAWQRLHDRRGWPAIEPAPEWLWLPPVDAAEQDLDEAVERALDDWLKTIKARRNDDAA